MIKRVILFVFIFVMICSGSFCFAEDKVGVVISWNPNTESDLMAYHVYEEVSSVDFVKGDPTYIVPKEISERTIVNGKITIKVDITVTGDYYWRVTAIDTSFNESDFSNEVYLHIDIVRGPRMLKIEF